MRPALHISLSGDTLSHPDIKLVKVRSDGRGLGRSTCRAAPARMVGMPRSCRVSRSTLCTWPWRGRIYLLDYAAGQSNRLTVIFGHTFLLQTGNMAVQVCTCGMMDSVSDAVFFCPLLRSFWQHSIDLAASWIPQLRNAPQPSILMEYVHGWTSTYKSLALGPLLITLLFSYALSLHHMDILPPSTASPPNETDTRRQHNEHALTAPTPTARGCSFGPTLTKDTRPHQTDH